MIFLMSQEQLYREYRSRVLSYISARIASKEDAEDLCEEVFIKLFRLLEKYDEERAAISTLIYKITHDITVNYLRSHKSYVELSEEHALLPSAEDVVMDREKIAELTKALSKIPSQQRDILILRFYCGWTLVKIADEMGLTYDTVVSRQKSAFEALRKLLENR